MPVSENLSSQPIAASALPDKTDYHFSKDPIITLRLFSQDPVILELYKHLEIAQQSQKSKLRIERWAAGFDAAFDNLTVFNMVGLAVGGILGFIFPPLSAAVIAALMIHPISFGIMRGLEAGDQLEKDQAQDIIDLNKAIEARKQYLMNAMALLNSNSWIGKLFTAHKAELIARGQMDQIHDFEKACLSCVEQMVSREANPASTERFYSDSNQSKMHEKALGVSRRWRNSLKLALIAVGALASGVVPAIIVGVIALFDVAVAKAKEVWIDKPREAAHKQVDSVNNATKVLDNFIADPELIDLELRKKMFGDLADKFKVGSKSEAKNLFADKIDALRAATAAREKRGLTLSRIVGFLNGFFPVVSTAGIAAGLAFLLIPDPTLPLRWMLVGAAGVVVLALIPGYFFYKHFAKKEKEENKKQHWLIDKFKKAADRASNEVNALENKYGPSSNKDRDAFNARFKSQTLAEYDALYTSQRQLLESKLKHCSRKIQDAALEQFEQRFKDVYYDSFMKLAERKQSNAIVFLNNCSRVEENISTLLETKSDAPSLYNKFTRGIRNFAHKIGLADAPPAPVETPQLKSVPNKAGIYENYQTFVRRFRDMVGLAHAPRSIFQNSTEATNMNMGLASLLFGGILIIPFYKKDKEIDRPRAAVTKELETSTHTVNTVLNNMLAEKGKIESEEQALTALVKATTQQLIQPYTSSATQVPICFKQEALKEPTRRLPRARRAINNRRNRAQERKEIDKVFHHHSAKVSTENAPQPIPQITVILAS